MEERRERYKSLYEIYLNIDDEILLTFQNTEKLPKEILNSKHKSYNWLKSRIGFYPIWCVKIGYKVSFSEFERLIGSTLCGDRPYVFFLKTNIKGSIETSLYDWVDVHFVENAIPSELTQEDYHVRDKYNEDWKSFLSVKSKDDTVQVLINPKTLDNSNIIKIYKQKINTERKMGRMSFV